MIRIGTRLHGGQGWDHRVVIQCDLGLDVIVPVVPELVGLERTTDSSAIQHMCFGLWRSSDGFNIRSPGGKA